MMTITSVVQSGMSTAAAMSAAAARSTATWGVWPASRRASAASLSLCSPEHAARVRARVRAMPASSAAQGRGLAMWASFPAAAQRKERGAQGAADNEQHAADQAVAQQARGRGGRTLAGRPAGACGFS